MSVATLMQTAALAISIGAPGELSTSSDADCLARNIWFEARGSSFADKAAVAHVVMNRVADPAYPSRICDVVYQQAQFSWTLDKTSNAVIVKNSIDRRAWADSALAAQLVLAKRLPDLTGGATHYHANYVDPAWSDAMTIQAKFGVHIYYSDIEPAAGANR